MSNIRQSFQLMTRHYLRRFFQSRTRTTLPSDGRHVSAIDELTIARLRQGLRRGVLDADDWSAAYRRLHSHIKARSLPPGTALLDESLPWPPLRADTENHQPSDCTQSLPFRQTILADLRSLQDVNYVNRGIGSHALFILKTIAQHAGKPVDLIGLVDPDLGPLPNQVVSLCSTIRPTFASLESQTPALFLSLSPMTHDTRLAGMLLDRPNILPIGVVYDFIPLEYPERYLADTDQRLRYQAALAWLEAYSLWLPISRSSAAALAKRIGICPDRTIVTGVALRPAFEAHLKRASVTAPDNRTPPPALLFTGGPDVRKNLDTVVAAHRILIAAGHPSIQLVVVGDYPADWRRNVLRFAGSTAERISFLDRISDEELAAWYQRATVAVSASLAEGFSLPVIEAIACGCPMVVSDIPAHRELIEDPSCRYPPSDARALADRLSPFFDSRSHRDRVAGGQQPIARRFTQTEVAAHVWQAIQRGFAILGQRDWRVEARPRRLAIVSPFPPDHSGVADYTKRTIEALAGRVEVDLYTDQEAANPTAGIRRIHPVSAAAWLRPDYTATLAVVGNSHFHTKIIDLHAMYGGPCLVHDNRLAEVIAWSKGVDYLRLRAERVLRRTVTTAEVHHWLHNPGSLPTLFYDDIIGKAAPFMVHSRGLQAKVWECYRREATYLPFCVYRGFETTELTAAARLAARSSLGVPADQLMIITLGLVHATKLPDTCIDAIARLHQAGHSVHLYFAGASGPLRDELLKQSERTGVAGSVHFADDWLDEEDYRRYLIAADAGIQLRSHCFGGLSGALLDCIAAGLPTVANADLAEALGAPHFVHRVPDQPSAENLAEALSSVLGTSLRVSHEQARCEFLTEHAFTTYADQLVRLLTGCVEDAATDSVPLQRAS